MTLKKTWGAKRARLTVPSIVELQHALEKPLSDVEKIPLPQALCNRLVDVREECQLSDVNMLFRLDDECISRTVLTEFYKAVERRPPLLAGTEDSFHVFWDENIRQILMELLKGATDIRNSNFHTATAKSRPDFAIILNGHCVFRGEEKGPNNSEDPKKELSDKLLWVYSGAPYVIGQSSCSVLSCHDFS
jgi:hypothetical protein